MCRAERLADRFQVEWPATQMRATPESQDDAQSCPAFAEVGRCWVRALKSLGIDPRRGQVSKGTCPDPPDTKVQFDVSLT